MGGRAHENFEKELLMASNAISAQLYTHTDQSECQMTPYDAYVQFVQYAADRFSHQALLDLRPECDQNSTILDILTPPFMCSLAWSRLIRFLKMEEPSWIKICTLFYLQISLFASTRSRLCKFHAIQLPFFAIHQDWHPIVTSFRNVVVPSFTPMPNCWIVISPIPCESPWGADSITGYKCTRWCDSTTLSALWLICVAIWLGWDVIGSNTKIFLEGSFTVFHVFAVSMNIWTFPAKQFWASCSLELWFDWMSLQFLWLILVSQ
jgi:hypothetical protein